MKITSPAFLDGASIPSKYTCDSFYHVSPPLEFHDVPKEAKSLVLIMDDPDVPKALLPGGVFDHWIMFNIPSSAYGIDEGGSAGVPGLNTAGTTGYVYPCPPSDHEPSEHRYVFMLYALNTMIGLKEGATKNEVLAAIKKHIISECKLTGRYKKIKKV
jgi:Raf kinase inhibitor-like YbhB/YbcL family protein